MFSCWEVTCDVIYFFIIFRSIQVGDCRCRLCKNGVWYGGAVPSVTTTTSVFDPSSPENEVCRCIGTRVGQKNNKPPSSWETTAALPQMFLTNKAMNIFRDSRRHDRFSLIQRPCTIEEEEVTFSEEEDDSVEKGRRQDARCLGMNTACCWYWLLSQVHLYMNVWWRLFWRRCGAPDQTH